jgi:hypothetical protein
VPGGWDGAGRRQPRLSAAAFWSGPPASVSECSGLPASTLKGNGRLLRRVMGLAHATARHVSSRRTTFLAVIRPTPRITRARSRISGFRLRAGFGFRRLICVTELSKPELNAIVEDNLGVPFETTVLGIKVTVTGTTRTSHGLVADCVRGRHRQAIHLLDLPLPEPPPPGAEWIAAYRHWAR